MRRAVGVARVQQQQQTQQRMADYGAQITAERVAHIADELEHLEQQLRTLSAKYKDDIKHDPLVRARFRQIADSLGVDLLSSKRNVFAGVLGLGDFYYRLASKLVEVCMREEAYCGGYVPLPRVMQYVQQSYDAAAAAAAANSDKDKKSKASKAERKRTTLSVDDVLTALGKLRVLGSGYSVVEINGMQYIQTASADSTAGSDATALLGVVHALRDKQVQAAVARQHAAAAAAATTSATSSTPTTSDTAAPPRRRVGAAYVLAARNTTTTTASPASDSDASLFQAQCVAVTEAQLCEALPWPLHRLRTALQRAVQSGAAWVDRNDDYDTTVTIQQQQQQQQQHSQYASSSDKEQAWLLRVVYWFMPELNASNDGRDGAVGGLRTDDVTSPIDTA